VVITAQHIGSYLPDRSTAGSVASAEIPSFASKPEAPMSGTPSSGRPHESGTYEIRFTGHLDRRWSAWFDGLTVTHAEDGTTVLRGPVVDQAALHGLLQKVNDLAMPLISVTRVEPDPHSTSQPR
jgi:hypothetical protein